jgi:hypothetical protein
MKRGIFILGGLPDLPKGLAGSGKIKPAAGGLLFYGGKQIMGPVDVGIDGRKFIFKGIADKALGRQMITFIRLNRFNNVEDAGVTFHGTGMQGNFIQDMAQPPKAMERIFQGHPADKAVDLIPLGK